MVVFIRVVSPLPYTESLSYSEQSFISEFLISVVSETYMVFPYPSAELPLNLQLSIVTKLSSLAIAPPLLFDVLLKHNRR